MSNLKKFNDFIEERFGSYRPIPFESPKINQFSQGTPNGMAGTSEPKNKTVDPDDQVKVGYKRFIRDFENTNKTGNKLIDGEIPKRRWRKKREKKRVMRLNELFEPRDIDFEILKERNVFQTLNAIKMEYYVSIEGLGYVFYIIVEDEYLTIEFFKYSKEEGSNYGLTGHNNMLKILNVIGHVFQNFKQKMIDENTDYIITDLIVSPNKLDSEKELVSDETKRGKIYKYVMDKKLEGQYQSYYSDKNEMTYRFDPAISVIDINLI
jgi:hypothetical protein